MLQSILPFPVSTVAKVTLPSHIINIETAIPIEVKRNTVNGQASQFLSFFFLLHFALSVCYRCCFFLYFFFKYFILVSPIRFSGLINVFAFNKWITHNRIYSHIPLSAYTYTHKHIYTIYAWLFTKLYVSISNVSAYNCCCGYTISRFAGMFHYLAIQVHTCYRNR